MAKQHPERLFHHSSPEYQAYIHSSYWLDEIRPAALEFYGRECQACRGAPKEIDVHHLSYHQLRMDLEIEDWLPDLLPMCRRCHDEVHQRVKELRKSVPSITIREVTLSYIAEKQAAKSEDGFTRIQLHIVHPKRSKPSTAYTSHVRREDSASKRTEQKEQIEKPRKAIRSRQEAKEAHERVNERIRQNNGRQKIAQPVITSTDLVKPKKIIQTVQVEVLKKHIESIQFRSPNTRQYAETLAAAYDPETNSAFTSDSLLPKLHQDLSKVWAWEPQGQFYFLSKRVRGAILSTSSTKGKPKRKARSKKDSPDPLTWKRSRDAHTPKGWVPANRRDDYVDPFVKMEEVRRNKRD